MVEVNGALDGALDVTVDSIFAIGVGRRRWLVMSYGAEAAATPINKSPA
jgi:hypothetical protein